MLIGKSLSPGGAASIADFTLHATPYSFDFRLARLD